MSHVRLLSLILLLSLTSLAAQAREWRVTAPDAVSYTHLTLPTICSV